jgi:hypothetical protein
MDDIEYSYNESLDEYFKNRKKIEAEEEAKRFNQGKVDYSQVPLDLLDGAAKVMTYGKNKYGANNFRKGYSDLNSPLASLIRHTVKVQLAIQQEDLDGSLGCLLDEETKEAHIHHIITSAMILVHALRLKGYKV